MILLTTKITKSREIVAMAGVSLKSVEEAQEHAEITSHSNFAESTEAVLNLVCTTCSKPCRSKTEDDAKPALTPEEAKIKLQEPSIMSLPKAEKEEKKRAREKIRQKPEEDKPERRQKLGLPPEDPTTATAKPSVPVGEEKKEDDAKVSSSGKANKGFILKTVKKLIGKKAKKKVQDPSNTISNMLSEEPSQAENIVEGAVEAVKEKQACVHFDKGLNLDKVLDKIKSSWPIKCEECKEGVHERGTKAKGDNGKKEFSSSEPKSDKKAIWLCLECGCYVCGGNGRPIGAKSHVVKHIRLTRHLLVIQWENPQLRWCVPCHSFLPVEKEENGEKRDVLLEVVKLIKGRSLDNLVSSDIEEQFSGNGSITSDIKLEGAGTGSMEAREGYVVRSLVNLGNTCFFNSIMQNLLSLDLLRDHFLNEDGSVVGGPLACSQGVEGVESTPYRYDGALLAAQIRQLANEIKELTMTNTTLNQMHRLTIFEISIKHRN